MIPNAGRAQCVQAADPCNTVTEVAIAADVLNRMLDLGRPSYVRIA